MPGDTVAYRKVADTITRIDIYCLRFAWNNFLIFLCIYMTLSIGKPFSEKFTRAYSITTESVFVK